MENKQHAVLTDSIICSFYSTYNKLGYGFLEKIYEKALAIELHSRGIKTVTQSPVAVHYEGQVIGEYFCDLMIEDKVIIEVKATRQLCFLNTKHNC